MRLLSVPPCALSLFLFMSLAKSAFVAQFCNPETSQLPVPICVAATAYHNSSTSTTDLIATFGWQKANNGGWAGVGLGSVMYGALMIVSFTEWHARENTTVSVRSGKWVTTNCLATYITLTKGEYRGHFEPKMSPKPSGVELLSVSLNGSLWLEVSFACYGCGNRESKIGSSIKQPWIWAMNSVQQFSPANEDSSLLMHDFYGHFDLDMTESFDDFDSIAIPRIDFSRPNHEDIALGTASPPAYLASLFAIHGTIAGLGFLVILPLGAISICIDSANALLAHLCFQLTATFLCWIAGGFAMYAARGLSLASLISEPHVVVGIFLMLFLAMQPILGFLHHKNFKNPCRVRNVTVTKIWTGRLLIVGGCANVILGFNLDKVHSRSVPVWVVFTIIVDIVLVAWLSSRSFRTKSPDTAKQRLVHNDTGDNIPFLEIDVDDCESDIDKLYHNAVPT